MTRTCQPELLDHLPADDSQAIQSRRDLRRVNSWMGNSRFIAHALNRFVTIGAQPRILEIGAGDGTFFLKTASRVHANGSAALLDRQNLLTPVTRAQIQKLGWQVETITADVFEHLKQPGNIGPGRPPGQTSPAHPTTAVAYDVILANLFLHHFSDRQLSELFQLATQITSLFLAVEPRRSPVSLFAGRFLWALGCNAVTRHDAIVSIRAGFSGRELSSLWPQTSGWACEEHPAGFSSHLFIAQRLGF
jgi:hypothetical protein